MKSLKNSLYPKARLLPAKELRAVYQTLRDHFGHQHWWPGDTPFEVIVGAILTQNTSWKNVEKAIGNLKQKNKLTPEALHRMSLKELAGLIRPAGYFNVKAQRLKNFIQFLQDGFGGNLEKMFQTEGTLLRRMLLSVKGIGPETADSILLYAGARPFFVVDAYTKRIFSRHRLQIHSRKARPFSERELLQFPYADWQNFFSSNFPRDVSLYNDFHAQIVALGKFFCKTTKALCPICPLQKYL